MVQLDGFLVYECNWGVEGEVWNFLIWVVVVVSGLIGGREEGGRFRRIGGDFRGMVGM